MEGNNNTVQLMRVISLTNVLSQTVHWLLKESDIRVLFILFHDISDFFFFFFRVIMRARVG